MDLKVIAYAHNGHTDKFGIPRQSREESPILTRIVFEPDYNVREALRGIEGFSHLWLIWGFANQPTANDQLPLQGAGGLTCDLRLATHWSPTVRPPRLGGNTRMGVFATRSPFRPNAIGLSSVKLIDVQSTKEKRIELIVSGADVMDGTPVYDIKPYLSYSDCHPNALNGFAEETKDYQLDMHYTKEDLMAEWEMDEKTAEDILYILRQDPRPAYQDDPLRVYKMDYDGWKVSFRVENGIVKSLQCIR